MERRPSQTWTRTVFNRFILVQCLLFLLPLLGSYIDPVLLGNVRNSQILATLIFLAVLWRSGVRLSDILAWRCSRKLWMLMGVVTLASYIGTGATHFLGLRLNGEDFSIFDWMLFNTNHREFMTSPICNMASPLGFCHHFAIHPTYIMIPLAFLHRLFEQPWLLILVHSVALWSGVIPLKALARRFLDHDILVLAVLMAYLGNCYVGAILNHGFHVEVFYAPFGLWLLKSWVVDRKSWLIWALLFLSIKEDAALYLIAFALAHLLFKLRDRRSWLVLSLSSAVLLLNLLWVQPHFLQLAEAEAPSYLRFWGHLGQNKREILRTIVLDPWQTLTMLLQSHWYRLFGSLLFLPMLSLQALMAMAPALLIYGLSNISHMREYATYYAAPLIPFLFYGLVKGARGRSPIWLLAACLIFALTGGGYQKFPPIAFSVLKDLREARAFLETQDKKLVCAQTLLYPHLPYAWPIQPLSTECMDQPEAITLFLSNVRYDSYPLGSAEFVQLASQVPRARLVRSYPSGLQIFQRF